MISGKIGFLTIDAKAGQRLDNFLLSELKGVPKSHIYRIVRAGEVRVNKKRAAVNYRLEAGDVVRVPPLRLPLPAAPLPMAASRLFLPILFEDDAFLAIDKPDGVAVHGGSGVSFGAIEALRAARDSAKYLELAHRLDKETSGILLIAKKRIALNALHEMFRDQGSGIDKRYLVLVKGAWKNAVQHARFPLRKYLLDNGERRVSVDSTGKASHTIFRLLACWQGFGNKVGDEISLLEAQLKTGRTHQIRVHLAHLGFPVLGDEKYGDFSLNKVLQKQGLSRMALHAWRLSFPHPLSQAPIHLEANFPPVLQRYLTNIQQEAPAVFSSPKLHEILHENPSAKAT